MTNNKQTNKQTLPKTLPLPPPPPPCGSNGLPAQDVVVSLSPPRTKTRHESLIYIINLQPSVCVCVRLSIYNLHSHSIESRRCLRLRGEVSIVCRCSVWLIEWPSFLPWVISATLVHTVCLFISLSAFDQIVSSTSSLVNAFSIYLVDTYLRSLGTWSSTSTSSSTSSPSSYSSLPCCEL